MTNILDVFDNLDRWRHLPNYQLERRSDIFFSIYLKEVLEHKFSVDILDSLIPEFPVHVGTVFPNRNKTNKSFKVDYLAVSKDLEHGFLIELKTECKSLRREQNHYLAKAEKVGVRMLLCGLVQIFEATSAKRKYHHLFTVLESIGLLTLHERVHHLIKQPNPVGIKNYIRHTKIRTKEMATTAVYVLPNGFGKNIVNFDEFSSVIAKHTDDFTKRFRQSLLEWSSLNAGAVNV